ncbi:hypothetical protein [Paenibacillus gansuensis]|uniref:Uncharacterized protein n=1 Tax=Paenibacillus gansuensis TaxID=306542 RepID=A0ABW5PGU8_9BACL
MEARGVSIILIELADDAYSPMTTLEVDIDAVLPSLRSSPRGLNPKGFSSPLILMKKAPYWVLFIGMEARGVSIILIELADDAYSPMTTLEVDIDAVLPSLRSSPRGLNPFLGFASPRSPLNTKKHRS